MKSFKKAILPAILCASVVTLSGCSSDSLISTKAGNVTNKEIIDYIGPNQISKAATDIATKKVLLDKYKNKIDDKHVEAELNKTIEQYGGKDKFDAALKQQGFDKEKYKEALKVKTAQAYMILDEAGVGEDKLKEEYENSKVQYHLAHILISVKSDTNKDGLSDEEAKAKIDEVKQKLDAGGDFAALAKEYSTDKSNADKGGDLGLSSKATSSFVSEFNDVAYNLKKDEVSDVVKTQFGYHIIKALDVKEMTFDEMKADIAESMAQKTVAKDKTIYQNALKKLFDEYKVSGSNDAVKKQIESMTNPAPATPKQNDNK